MTDMTRSIYDRIHTAMQAEAWRLQRAEEQREREREQARHNALTVFQKLLEDELEEDILKELGIIATAPEDGNKNEDGTIESRADFLFSGYRWRIQRIYDGVMRTRHWTLTAISSSHPTLRHDWWDIESGCLQQQLLLALGAILREEAEEGEALPS